MCMYRQCFPTRQCAHTLFNCALSLILLVYVHVAVRARRYTEDQSFAPGCNGAAIKRFVQVVAPLAVVRASCVLYTTRQLHVTRKCFVSQHSGLKCKDRFVFMLMYKGIIIYSFRVVQTHGSFAVPKVDPKFLNKSPNSVAYAREKHAYVVAGSEYEWTLSMVDSPVNNATTPSPTPPPRWREPPTYAFKPNARKFHRRAAETVRCGCST